MTYVVAVSVLSSAGLGLSAFLCSRLLRNPDAKSRLLALLFLFLALRITKSVFYSMTTLPLVVKNLGLAANLPVGPLLFLYIQAALTRRKPQRTDGLHFFPSLFFVVLSPFIPNGPQHPSWLWLYGMVLLQSFSYVALSVLTLRRHRIRQSPEITWLYLLTGSLSVVWIMYTLIFVQLVPLYALGPITFSFLMFLMLYYFVDNQRIFEASTKYLNTSISDDQALEQLTRMRQLMTAQKLFKDPSISLSKMSGVLGISERNVSLIINKYAGQNFTSFIHSYRIEEAKRILSQPRHQKVLAVAYEVGFNNLATFNHSFKKQTGMTPTGFRAAQSKRVDNHMQDS